MQQSGAVVQQPVNLDSGQRFILKVQPARAASGLGRAKGASNTASPLWALIEGVNTLWEYNTADLELIFNLVEEAILAARSAMPREERSDAALSVLEDMAAAHGISNIGFDNRSASQSPQQSSFGSQPAQSGFSGGGGGGYNDPDPGFGGSNQSGFGGGGGSQSFSSSDNSSSFSSAGRSPSYQSMEQPHTQSSGQFSAQFQVPPQPPPPPKPPSGGMQMSGNLSELGVCDLFQSISVAKMTGRLDLSSGLESIEIYFEEGAPRRAAYRTDTMTGPPRDIQGEEVLLEGMTWKNGFFQFNAAMKSTERSPMRRLDLLLLEGAALKDYSDALDKAGLTPDSVPIRVRQVSEADFEKALTEGIPVDMAKQKKVYMGFNGKSALMDIVRDTGMPKSGWLPLVFNLLNCNLIGLEIKQQAQAATADVAQSPMIKEAIKEAFMDMMRPDTSMLSYELFMHFLEVEFQRALRLRLPFSLVLISVHKEGAGIKEQLSSEDLKALTKKIRDYLEPYDHVGHYQTLDVGILLPHRPSTQARDFAKQIIDDVNRDLAQSGNGVRFVWSVGIGCVPEDGIKLGGMISKAEKERNGAQAERV